MASKTVLNPYGIKSLRKFLQDELATLRPSPILVIGSEPAVGNSSPPIAAVANSCQLVQFTLAQQMGLRTVPSSISSAYPTLQDLEERMELLRRTGASSVVAVGSGAAMDLAKALSMGKELEHLILVPSTYAAMTAAASSHSLMLDSTEETIVPLPSGNSGATTVAPLEEKMIAPVDSAHVLYASLAIVLDAEMRKSEHPLLPAMTQQVCALLDNPDEELSHETALSLLHQSGSLLSFGLGPEDRSAPLALASSLIPRIFPHAHILTFWAALVPGLCHVLHKSSGTSPEIAQLVERLLAQPPGTSMIPPLTVNDETMQGFSVPDMALSHIQANQTVWKAFDVPDRTLTEILQHSLQQD